MSERNIKVFKRDERKKTPHEYERDVRIALLTLLIEADPDRAKIIIERIAASKETQAA